MRSCAEDIARTLTLFHPANSVVEIRAFAVRGSRKGVDAGYFDDFQRAAQRVARYEATQPEGIYFTLNECHPGLIARCPNEFPRHVDGLTSDGDILRRRWLLIDVDPRRPKGVSSTDAQLEASLATAQQISEYLASKAWAEPVNAISGNGGHLVYPIDLPNDEPSRLLVAGVLKALDGKFSNDVVAVDCSVYNASRITKLYGTYARKGVSTRDRPHRRSELTYVPDYLEFYGWRPEDAVPLSRLQELVALAADFAPGGEKSADAWSGCGKYARLRVPAWLADRGVTFTERTAADGRAMWTVECPFDTSHGRRGETCILQHSSGRMGFKCQHDSCHNYDWQDAKRAIGLPDPHHYDPPLNRMSKKPKAQASFAAKVGPIAPGTVVLAGDRGNYGKVLQDNGTTCTVKFTSEEGQTATKELSKSDLRTQDGQALDPEAEPTRHIDVLASPQFDATEYRQSYLIKKILVAEQPAIVGGKSKTLKTSLLVDLTVSLGTGTLFLGKFETTPAKVALLSGESGGFVIQETARRICRARGIALADVEAFWGFTLPQITRPGDLRGLSEVILANGVEVVVIDPAYLCLLGGDTRGRNASNVFDMGPLLLGLSEVGEATNSTIVLCHHCRKNLGEPFAVPELEDLSMAGFAEWARQWLLLGRREAYDQGSGQHRIWLNVGGSAGHSGLYAVDVDEGQLLDDFSGRKWEVEVKNAAYARQEEKARKAHNKAVEKESKENDFRFRLLDTLKLPDCRNGETENQLRKLAGLNGENFGTAVRLLLKEGRVERCDVAKRGRTYDAYRWTGK